MKPNLVSSCSFTWFLLKYQEIRDMICEVFDRYEGYENLPLPPPWRKIENQGKDDVEYSNDITKEVTRCHPFLRYINEQQTLESEKQVLVNLTTETLDSHDLKAVTSHNRGSPLPHSVNFENSPYPPKAPETVMTQLTDITNKGEKCSEFKCAWKELGLFGDRSVFGLTIRFFFEDEHTLVRFDGVDGEWEYSVLEGLYGPVTRHDLFIGAKVKIFGRSLAVTSASRTVCAWIDNEYKKLLKRQETLRLTVEKFGFVPVVHRQNQVQTTNFSREGRGEGGRCDLRRVHNENSRLGDQLASLGLV